MRIEQLAWDFDAMLAEDNPPSGYAGRAPLRFTTEAFTADELSAAFDWYKKEVGNFDSFSRSHMWHGSEGMKQTPGHAVRMFSASLGCWHYRPVGWDGLTPFHHCPTSYLHRMVCECEWVSGISESESAVIWEWHDHAWPGWRDLPVVPKDVRPMGGGITAKTKAPYAWVLERYPADFRRPGAPIITERASGGTRHVPGYSPWGGYDLAAVTT